MDSSIDLSFNEIKRVKLRDHLEPETGSLSPELHKYRHELTNDFAKEVALPSKVASKRFIYGNFESMPSIPQ